MMGLFKKAKIAKPNKREKKIIDKRLRKKYPQMYSSPVWLAHLKKAVKKELKTVRTKSIEDRLRAAGLTDKEIAKLRGK